MTISSKAILRSIFQPWFGATGLVAAGPGFSWLGLLVAFATAPAWAQTQPQAQVQPQVKAQTAAPNRHPTIQLGPRPFYLVNRMTPGKLKDELSACAAGPFRKADFSIGHRGAALQFPEHSRQSYLAAARMGAGIIECDVTFTKDRQLVCRHSQCDLHQTTNILQTPLAAKCSQGFTPADPISGRKASAKCCTSDLTLAEFLSLHAKMDAVNRSATTVRDYLKATPRWRTDLYVPDATLMTLKDAITLFERLGVKHTPELKAPSVKMPFNGSFTQSAYAKAMIAAYRAAGVDPKNVFAQSFNLDDIYYWIAKEPDFGRQAVYLDGRYRDRSFNPNNPASWSPSMATLKAKGVNYIAPPMWVLVTLDKNGRIVPSSYALAARKARLKIITWTMERSGPLSKGGGWYYRTVRAAIRNDGDMMRMIDVLATKVKVVGIFSDWPATTTYYANCRGLD